MIDRALSIIQVTLYFELWLQVLFQEHLCLLFAFQRRLLYFNLCICHLLEWNYYRIGGNNLKRLLALQNMLCGVLKSSHRKINDMTWYSLHGMTDCVVDMSLSRIIWELIYIAFVLMPLSYRWTQCVKFHNILWNDWWWRYSITEDDVIQVCLTCFQKKIQSHFFIL